MDRIKELGDFAKELGCTSVCFHEPMSSHTTFHIGGPADLFLTVPNAGTLQKFCRRAAELEVPMFPLGNGSNLLVSDGGIRGAVVTFGGDLKRIALVSENTVRCGAGASLASLCNFAREHSLTGIEFTWGIPGSAGGATFMNSGAYEHSMSEVVTAASHVTIQGESGTLKGAELDFGYRKSAYMCGGRIITSLRVELKHGRREEIAARMEELYDRRKAKQPLELPSAGSVFKRPQGHYAGTLIQQCGLKGRRIGGAAVSEKHAGFIVNLGGATCADVEKLIGIIQETVLKETGVTLECEVKKVG